MSEFTVGILFLKKDMTLAQLALQSIGQPCKIKALNDQWLAILPEQANPALDPLRGWVLNYCNALPVMFFEHGEDHGWGYKIYYTGQEIASLSINYELAYNLYLDVVEQQYPEIDLHLGFDSEPQKTIYEAILTSDSYHQEVKLQFQYTNVEQFSVFEISNEGLQELKTVLNIDWYLNPEHRKQQVTEFKRLLNISEMSWLSYHYLTLEE